MSLWVIDYLCLAGVLACGVLVVVLRNANAAVMALSAMGVLLTVVFVVLGAPDVAHAEIVVGAIVLPTLYLVAIGKVRAQVEDRTELGENGGRDG
jgi:uncharacterized MnhB-related membrane protein